MKTEITELLGMEYPVIQGGMAWVAECHLAAAVSNAGGLGLIAAGGAPAEWVREQIRETKKLTDKPFGVNIMLMNPESEKVAKVIVEEGVKVVTTGAGSPEKYMADWKAAGVKVIPVVASVALAKRMERCGADAVVAEGCEAGGHIGELTTMVLVPQVVDAVKIPVIGMGGIAGHMFVDMPADRTGYLHKASLLQDMSAVTVACLLMKKEVFEQAGGFTEELAVAFNDVDLCLKVRKNGYLIVYDPYAKLYHMESKTRGAEDSKEKVRRFQTEIEYMRCHWIDILKNGDPCYNKNLSLTKWNYSLKPIPGMETEAGQKKEKTGRKSCRKYQ